MQTWYGAKDYELTPSGGSIIWTSADSKPIISVTFGKADFLARTGRTEVGE